MSHKSITFATELDPSADEGMAVTVRNLVDAAKRRGMDVETLYPSPGAPEVARRGYVVWAAARIATTRRRTTVVYVPRAGLTRASIAKGTLLARATTGSVVQLVLQVREGSLPRLSADVSYAVLSEAIASEICRRNGSATVLRLGVNRDVFHQYGPKDSSSWRRPGPRLLHVGHLRNERNVRALGDLAKAGYSCLLVASPSTVPDNGLRQRLIADGVTIVRHHVADLAAVYRAADAYVFPVVDPGACTTMPVSILESLACGTQVVTTSFGAIGESLRDVGGVWFASPDALVENVEAAIQSPSPVAHDAVGSWDDTLDGLLTSLRKRRARLVVLLGLDGTGKSTQARLLAQGARERQERVTTVWARWQPRLLAPLLRLRGRGDGDASHAGVGGAIPLKFRLFRYPAARALWRRAAAADHFIGSGPGVFRALRGNSIVICDRYYHDALVDMGVAFDEPAPTPVGLHRLFPKPDIVILLDASENELRQRCETHSARYFEARRPLYLELARRNGWPVVDAARPIEEVHAEISRYIWDEG